MSGFLSVIRDLSAFCTLHFACKQVTFCVQSYNCAAKNHWASYQLGRIYLFGAKDIERDKEKAVEWFTKSANDGNEYAQDLLENMERYENAVLANTIFGLFANLSRCIEDDYTQKYKLVRRTVDSRLRRMISQKKLSLGIKEEQAQNYE